MRFLLLTIFVAVLALAQCHICIMHPRQRGTMDISFPGSEDCYRRTDYCGGEPTESPRTSFEAGQPALVHMQQNLNHFWTQKPGFFDIRLSYSLTPTDDDWITLDRWDDWSANDMVWQMNFTRVVQMPQQTCSHCILGMRYVSYNVDEVDPSTNTDSIFYNCADITLTSSSSRDSSSLSSSASSSLSSSLSSQLVSVRAPSDSPSCCAPARFTASGQSSGPNGLHSHTVYYDMNKLYVRWDRIDHSNPANSLITITNYTAGQHTTFEYLIQSGPRTCELYGSDCFYSWCFGEQRSQAYAGNMTVNGVEEMVWQNFSNDFSFTSDANVRSQ